MNFTNDEIKQMSEIKKGFADTKTKINEITERLKETAANAKHHSVEKNCDTIRIITALVEANHNISLFYKDIESIGFSFDKPDSTLDKASAKTIEALEIVLGLNAEGRSWFEE